MFEQSNTTNPIPDLIFIHNAAAYKVVRWDSEVSQWECRACGFAGINPTHFNDETVRNCLGGSHL